MQDDFPLIDTTGNAPEALYSLARHELMPVLDEAALGKIVQASEEILESQDRIQMEIASIGSNIAHIDRTIHSHMKRAMGDVPQARKRASTVLFKYCQNVLKISRSYVWLYLKAHAKFMNNYDAITPFNIGELQVIVHSEITDEHVAILAEAKRQNPGLKRSEFKALAKHLREQDEGLQTVNHQLEAAREDLANSLAKQMDAEYETKQLRAQVADLNSAVDRHRTALADTTEELSRRNGAVSQLNMTIDTLSKERESLKAALLAASTAPASSAAAATVDAAAAEQQLAALAGRQREVEAELAAEEQRLRDLRRQVQEETQGLSLIKTATEEFSRITESFSAMAERFEKLHASPAFKKLEGGGRLAIASFAAAVADFSNKLDLELKRV